VLLLFAFSTVRRVGLGFISVDQFPGLIEQRDHHFGDPPFILMIGHNILQALEHGPRFLGPFQLEERHGKNRVTIDCVDKAENKLDLDRIVEIVRAQPRQSQAALAAIIGLTESGEKNIETGDVFSLYERICASRGLKVLTQRRVSDLIAELDMLGIINAKVVSRGRYGRTKEIKLQLGSPVMQKIRAVLKENYLIRDSITEVKKRGGIKEKGIV